MGSYCPGRGGTHTLGVWLPSYRGVLGSQLLDSWIYTDREVLDSQFTGVGGGESWVPHYNITEFLIKLKTKQHFSFW